MQIRGKIVFEIGLLLALTTSCAKEAFVYPPVKMEFVSVSSNARGALDKLQPDKGPLLTIVEDRSATVVTPDTVMRVITNYERTSPEQAVVYAIGSVLTHTPEPRDSELFKDGIKRDPIGLESIWMGREYLNMVLLMKVREEMHFFQFVEEKVVEEADRTTVTLSLYHDASGDNEGYTQNVYASIPLQKYTSSGKEVEVHFCYRSDAGGMVETGPFTYKKK